MATKNRDVTMTLSVESLGQENIEKLEKSLRALAKEGGVGATQFGELADEVNRLGQQNQALQAVQKLSAATEQLAQKQVLAKERTETFAERLSVLAQASRDARDAEQQAAQELVKGRQAKTEASNALRELKAEYDATGKRTSEYRAKLQDATAEQSRANKELVKLRENNRTAREAVTEATQAQARAETALTRVNNAYSKTTAAVDNHNKALVSAGAAAEKLGLDVSDLGRAETQLQASLVKTTGSVQARKVAMAEMAEADRLLAIEARAMLDLHKKGEQALIQETMALQEAERGTRAYAAARDKALADEAAWQKEAYDLVEAAHAAQRLRGESEKLVAAQKELGAQRAFEVQAADAKKLVEASDYVRFWEDALDHAAAAQKEFAAQDAFNKTAENAAKLRQAADYVRFWEEELKRAEVQAAETAAAATTAANRIDSAFKTVGVRSVAEVRKEMGSVNEAMRSLAASGQLTGRELSVAMSSARDRTNVLNREIRELTGTLTLADKAAGLLQNSMGQIAVGNLIADGLASLIESVKSMGRAFVTANQDMDRLQRTMTQLHGSSGAAAEQIAVLRNVANLAGVSVAAITDSFIRFQASATASGMAVSVVNDVFQAVTVNGSRMGMSAERVSLALEALGQMASKGTVSMEELRQQLGDSLPGAFKIAAEGLGLTTQQLTKMVETGQVMADDFLPAFTRGLQAAFGDASKPVEGLWQSLARLENKFTELYQRANDSAGFRALGQAADMVAANFEALVTVVGGLGKAFLTLKLVNYVRDLGGVGAAATKAATGTAVHTAAIVANTTATGANTTVTGENTVTTGANTTASGANAKATSVRTTTTGANTTVTATNTSATVANTAALSANTTAVVANATASAAGRTSMGQLSGAAQGVAGAVRGAGSALVGMAGAARGLFAALGGLPGALLAVALNAKELGTWIGESIAKMGEAGRIMRQFEREAAEQAAAEKQRAREKEEAAAKELQAMQRALAGMVDLRGELVAYEAASKKSTDAEKIRAATVEKLAALYGEEARALGAASEATEINLAATVKERDARQTLVSALEAEVKSREDLIKKSTTRNEKAEEELGNLRALLGVKKEELAATNNSVEALQLEAAARRISAETYKDNSARVGEYKLAMDEARITLAELQEMERQGLPVKEALAAAYIDLAEQTRLYADAANDAKVALAAQLELDKSTIEVKRATLQVRIAELEQMAAAAKASGDLAKATQLEIEAKTAQISVLKLNAEAMRLEVEATRKAIEEELKYLEATGQLTDVKRKEIEARLANVKAKEIEAAASTTQVKSIEAEIAALRAGTTERKDATKAIDKETDSLSANTTERERAIAAREKELALQEREDEMYRKRWNMDKNNRTLDNDGNVLQMQLPSTGYIIDEGRSQGLNDEQLRALIEQHIPDGRPRVQGPAWFQAVNKAIADLRVTNLSAPSGGSSGGSQTTQQTGGTTTQAPRPPSSGRGVSLQINVVGQQDAQNLAQVLSILEADGGRAA